MAESDATARADVERMISITSERQGDGVVVLTVAGELDLLTTQGLEERLKEALSPPNSAVVLDLSQVRFLGSAALSALLACAESAKTGGIDFRLVASERATLRPLEITGVQSSFTIFDSVEDALNSVSDQA